MKKFRFQVINATGTAVVLYLLAGVFKTLGMTVDQEAESPFEVNSVTPHYQNVTALTNAGFASGNVLDDGEVVSGLTITAGDSTRGVRDFVNYVKFNKLTLAQMTVRADDESFFSQEISFSRSNPLKKNESVESLLYTTFKDKFANVDKEIDMHFEVGERPVLDGNSIVFTTIPTGRTVDFTLIFE